MLKKLLGIILSVCMISGVIPALAGINTAVITEVTSGKTENGSYYLDVTLDKPVTGVLAAAFYHGEILTDFQTEDIDANTVFPVHFGITTTDLEYAKVFVWTSLADAKPLGEEKDILEFSSSNLKVMTSGATIPKGKYDNIIISPEIGDGEVTLDGVTINGNLTILGGGSNSINLDDCTINGKVVINKAAGEKPRLNLINNTVLDLVEVKTPAILNREDSNSYIKKVVTTANLTSNGKVSPLIEVDEATNSGIVIEIQDVYGVDVVVNSKCGVAINAPAVNVTTELTEEPDNVIVNNAQLAHFCQWGEPEITMEPTCSQLGRKKMYCSIGEHNQWYDIPKIPHEPTGETAYFDSMHWYTCKNCSESLNVGTHYFPDDFKCETGGKCVVCEYKISPGTHNYGMYTITTPPTCSSTGIRSATCSRCGHVDNQTEYRLTHSFPTEPTRVVEPTCTVSGAKHYMCTNGYGCTYERKETISALGHTTDVGYTITKEATCNAEGSKSQICTRCDTAISTKTISKLAHTKGAGTVTTGSTCTTKGTMSYQCTNCYSVFTEDIPYLEHSFTNGICSVCSEHEYVDVSTSSELSTNIRNGQSVRLLCDIDSANVTPQNGATIYLNGFKIGTLTANNGDLIVDGVGGGSVDTIMVSGNATNLVVKNTAITTKLFANRSGAKIAMENCAIQTLATDYADVLTLKNCSIKAYSKINMIKMLEIELISATDCDLVIEKCDSVIITGATDIDIIASNNKNFELNHSMENPIAINEFRCSSAEILHVNGGRYTKLVSLNTNDEVVLNAPVMEGGISFSKIHHFTMNGGQYDKFGGSTTSNGSITINGGIIGSGAEYTSSSLNSNIIRIYELKAKDHLNITANQLIVTGVTAEQNATFTGKESLTLNEGNTIIGSATFVTDGVAVINSGSYLGGASLDRSLYSETGNFVINGGSFGSESGVKKALDVRAEAEIKGGVFYSESYGIYINNGSTVVVDGNAVFDTEHEAIQCYNGKVYINSYGSSDYYVLADTNTDGNIEVNGKLSHTLKSSAGYFVLREGFSTTKDVIATCDNAVSNIFFEDGITVDGNLKLSNAQDGMVDGISGGILGGTYNGETTISGRHTDLTIAGGTFEKITFTSLSDNSVLIIGGTFKNFNVDSGNTVTIAGGTFDKDVNQYVNSNLYQVTPNANGTYTVTKK